jgi:hypothetical protein
VPSRIPIILVTKKGVWWEKGRSYKNFEIKEGGLHSIGIAQIWHACQGHWREGKMGMVTIIPFVETISFISWTLVPLGTHIRGVIKQHVKNG